MPSFKVDIYIDEMYVKTEFVDADNIYDAEDKVAEKIEAALGFDIESLDE